MLPSVVAQRSIPTRHPVNTCLPVATLASRKKSWGHAFTMPTLVFSKAHPTRQFHNAGSRRRYRQCARATVGVRQEIRVTRLYRARMPSGWIGLDWTGLDWIGLDSTGSECPREISEAGTFHLFFSHRFFLPYRGMILRVLAERESGSQHFCIFFSFSPFPTHIFALDSFSSISMGRRMGYWRCVHNGEHRTVKR
jgi:hypothetical protein